MEYLIKYFPNGKTKQRMNLGHYLYVTLNRALSSHKATKVILNTPNPDVPTWKWLRIPWVPFLWQSSSWSSLFRWVGPNKFYGNISFIGRQAALFGNKGLWWGGGGGGGRVSQYTLHCSAFPQCVSFQCALIRCTARGHNGSHNGSQCSMFIGRTHTTWVTMGLTMVRGKRGRRGSHGFGQMLCFKLSGVVQPTAAAAIFLSDTAFQLVWPAPGLLMVCSWCRETPWEMQRDILKEGY